MNRKYVNLMALSMIAIFSLCIRVHAQQGSGGAPVKSGASKVDVGKWEYDNNCSTCHGPTGNGNGPFSQQMKTKVADLSLLSRRNGGVFPFKRVYDIIDGREDIVAHGLRDMPIWGRFYTEKGSGLGTWVDPEGFARAQILSLTEYVYRLQAK